MANRQKVEDYKDRTLSEMTMKRIVVMNDNHQQHDDNKKKGDDHDGIGYNNEDDINHNIKLSNKNKNKQQQHSKVVRQSFAVGGLDQDYIDWGMGTTAAAGSNGKIIRNVTAMSVG
jgi:hypothetical protein